MKYLGAPQSGSQANTTASRNRAGQYLRNRRSPVQPVGNGRRALVRGFFGAASQLWSSMSPSEQAAWNAYAAMYPTTDSLGQSVTLTGHQMFVAINSNKQNCGQAIGTAIPARNTVASPAPIVFAISLAAVAWTVACSGGLAGDFYNVALSAPQSSGVTFCKTFCQLASIDQDPGSVDIIALYTAQFGVPAIGNRVFLRVTPVNVDGVAGVPIELLTVVTA